MAATLSTFSAPLLTRQEIEVVTYAAGALIRFVGRDTKTGRVFDSGRSVEAGAYDPSPSAQPCITAERCYRAAVTARQAARNQAYAATLD